MLVPEGRPQGAKPPREGPAEPPPEVPGELELGLAPRCPYCHERVAPASPDKLACNACMAWHHQACWGEHTRCAACGANRSGTEPLRAEGPVRAQPGALTHPAAPVTGELSAREARVWGGCVAAVGGALTLVCCGLFLAFFGANGQRGDLIFLPLTVLSLLLTRFGLRRALPR